jgi:plastocyanin
MASTVAAPTTTTNVRVRPVYTRVAVLGLLFVAVAPVLFTAAGLLAGQSLAEEGPFFAVIIVLPLIGVALLLRTGLLGRIAGIVLSLAAAGGMWWTAFGLAAPASFTDFVGGVLVPGGILMGLGGSIAAIVSSRKGRVAAEATRGETRIMMTAVGILALAIVFSGIMTLTGKTTVDAAAAEGATEVGFSSFKFAEASYTVPAGDTKIVVHNSDAFVHDFAIPALGVDPVVVNPGSEKLVEFSAEPGSYIMFCTLHSDITSTTAEGQMAATLVVE